jgi:hypothetical protein
MWAQSWPQSENKTKIQSAKGSTSLLLSTYISVKTIGILILLNPSRFSDAPGRFKLVFAWFGNATLALSYWSDGGMNDGAV